jgi:hypothetical protein
MQNNEIRLGILSAVLGGVLVAGIGAVAMNWNSASAKEEAFAPKVEQQTLVVAAPEVRVPGYVGPLYNAQGHVVAVSTDKRSSAAAPAAPAESNAVVAKKGRSTGKSVAIVAGSAGAGAAIGAGGGKGAAIGAASGGTAGFIYDRVTAKK